MKVKTLFKSLAALAFAGFLAASAQAQTAPKLLIVDLAKLYDAHYETVEQNEKLRADEQKAQQKLEALNAEGNALLKEFQGLQEQLQNATLKDDAKAKIQKDAQAKAEEIQRKQIEVRSFTEDIQRGFRQRIGSFRQVLLEKISKTASDIAKRKGATLLIDKSGPSGIGISNVLYFDPAFDITEEVAKELDKGRPAGSAAPTAATPATAPSTKPAAKSSDAPSVSFPGSK